MPLEEGRRFFRQVFRRLVRVLGLRVPPGVRPQHPQHVDGLRKGRQGLFHGRLFPVPGAVHQKDVFAKVLLCLLYTSDAADE